MDRFRLILFLVSVSAFYKKGSRYYKLPKIEYEHAGEMYTTPLTRDINGSDEKVQHPKYTPDFRIEEPPYLRHHPKELMEEERPYRISPAYKQLRKWRSRESPKNLGCACVTVFKRTHVLGTGAVITTKHILTTATSTELILRNRRKLNRLYNILGAWYDTDVNSFNSSYYSTPVRIHYHPRYIKPKMVNRSHPIPAVYDIAVWTMMIPFYRSFFGSSRYLCPRGGSHWREYGSSVPRENEMAFIVGFQFIKAFKRKPMPWFKYVVRTRKHYQPCPKTEWGWFHCIRGNWAKLGLDSGACLFRALEGKSWRYDGLIGMNAVSMILRSFDMVHYFTVLDCHPVLDFLYAAYMGLQRYEYLDKRFMDTKWKSPQTNMFVIDKSYTDGHEHYKGMDLPNY